MDKEKFIDSSVKEVFSVLDATISSQVSLVVEIAKAISSCLDNGGKLLLCGNGGSAADCQHIAAEFVNRFKQERRPLPAIALTTDTSILTAISNDYEYQAVFEKQVQALGKRDDVLVGISTSGTSENVIRALAQARRQGMITVGLSGANTGPMQGLCDYLFKVTSHDTPRIQEVHIFVAHLLCELVERDLFER